MTAQHIADLINIVMSTYSDRTVGENADLTVALWALARAEGTTDAVREHLRRGRLRDYEAPANG